MSNLSVTMKPIGFAEQVSKEPSTSRVAKNRRGSLARQLAEAHTALVAARERIDTEVLRRQVVEQEFDRHVLAERERVRKQLHDGLGQMLTSISFLASSLRARLNKCGISDAAELDDMQALVNQAIVESKTIAAGCDENPRPRGIL